MPLEYVKVMLLLITMHFFVEASINATTNRAGLECEFPPRSEQDLTHVRRKRLATASGLVCLEDYPYTVSVRSNEVHKCGGAIVGRQWILSAADCLEDVDVDSVSVRAGSVYRDYGGVLLSAVSIDTHPGYTPQAPEHNLALIKVNVPITTGPRTQPVRLPVMNMAIPTRAGEIVVTGYGAVSGELLGGVQQELRRMLVRSYPKDQCRRSHGDAYSLQFDSICLESIAPGVELCAGDVGDPAVYFSGLERAGTLHSVAVFPGSGSECPPRGPGVYTEVAFSREWIDLVMSDNLSSSDSDEGNSYYSESESEEDR